MTEAAKSKSISKELHIKTLNFTTEVNMFTAYSQQFCLYS